MITERIHFTAVLCLLATLGCATQVEEEGVEETEQALNSAEDFRVAVMNISYADDGTLVETGKEGWTSRLSAIIGGGVVGAWSSVARPTGLKIGLQTYAGQPPNLANRDFRLVLSSRGPGDTDWLDVRTPWASDGGGQTAGGPIAGATFPWSGKAPAQFRVGLETRPWPSTNARPLIGYRFGINTCALDAILPIGCFEQDWKFTKWNVDMPGGGVSWSHTSDRSPGHQMRGAQARLDIAFAW